MRRRFGIVARATLATCLLGLVSLALTANPALAVFSHSVVEKSFSAAGTSCTDIGVVESTETVYVDCISEGKRAIEKYDYEGNPVNFSFKAPYISANKIVEDPGNVFNGKEIGPRFAADNSSAHNGFLFLATGEGGSDVDYFRPSGEMAGGIAQPLKNAPLFCDFISDVDVAADGSVYAAAHIPSGRVSRYNSQLVETERLYPVLGNSCTGAAKSIAVDSTGAAWTEIRWGSPGGPPSKLSKFEADQFTADLSASVTTTPAGQKALLATPSPFFPDPLLPGASGFDTDPVTDDLYVPGSQIRTFSPGTAEEPAYQHAPSFGSSSVALAVSADQRIFAVGSAGNVVRYGIGDILPEIRTDPAAIDDIGHEEALLSGHVDLAGGDPITECKIEYGKTMNYESGEAPCLPDPSESPPGSNFSTGTDVSAEIAGLESGATYHYRFRAANSHGSNAGIDRTFEPAFVLRVKTLDATDVDEHGALLHGSLDPDGLPTTFHFEYGVDSDYGSATPEQAAGEGTGELAVERHLGGLPTGRTWHYRIVATNANGSTYGPDRTFRTSSVPDVAGARASEVGAASALLSARIDPVGYNTSYRFEYGTTPGYGSSIPVPDEDLGNGAVPVEVSKRIEGLRPGVTYHFRVVATNAWGTGVSPDTTFDFSPPSCPNDHVRQQTGSSYLPDCRAYELVSPGNAGAVVLFPSQEARDVASFDFAPRLGVWALNTGLATSPPRLSFLGAFGAVRGLDSPNFFLDLYLSTRTTAGWVTSAPALHGSEAAVTGYRECSESFSVCIDHKTGDGFSNVSEPPESAPYVFAADGRSQGRLPTNLGAVPGGQNFGGSTGESFPLTKIGSQRLSGDGGHYVFNSPEIVFAPGGVSGGLGSAYENDVAARTVTVVSKLPDGSPIIPDSPSIDEIEFPALSPDGSHVLMQTAATNGPSHLYMRVNGTVTYDVARGAGVEFVGATRDGSKVFFIATQQLTTDDTDTAVDLYMWQEAGDTLTRVSQGNGAGDTNSCTPSWVDSCGVEMLNTESGHPEALDNVPGLDDTIADRAGDVYFLSPEVLDAERPGIAEQPNLYVFRYGAVQLVATLDGGTTIDRIQISPDGSHAAFLTASRLTSYDNRGFKEMYTYDADAREIECASCDPSGLPPTADVEASQGGPFMSDDGRAFFATKDSLVPRDANGRITDVYEYVGGRPQLITLGLGSRDYTGGSGVLDIVTAPVYTGLESVSHDGTDVYFSTFDTLVPQDQNGDFVKFYDARTGGGFPPPPGLAPCEAADECHGADSSPPPSPVVATGASLGDAGQSRVQRGAKRKRAAAKRRQAKRRRAVHAEQAKRRETARRSGVRTGGRGSR